MDQDFEQVLKPAVDLPEALADYMTELCRVSALGYMSSAIMHEIGNALTVISGNVQIIQLRGADLEKDDMLKRMSLMMNQIARIEGTIGRVGSFGARLSGQIKRIDPHLALNNALYAFRRRCLIEGPEIHLHSEPGTCAIPYDPSLLEYAILEMLSLFLKVSENKDVLSINANATAGGWTIEATLTPKTPPNGKAGLWESGAISQTAAGTLFALDRHGGTAVVFRKGEVLGWRLRFGGKQEDA